MSPYLIRPISIFLLTLFSLSDGAHHSVANSLALPSAESAFKIELIDVKCDKDKHGMHIIINFSQPFGGVIYSQGYFDDPNCRYVSIGENKNSYEFIVPFKGCGSKPSCAICDSVDNVLIIQQDEEVQGEFDTARKVSCSQTGIDEEKKVFFKPFIVDMLDVITVPTSHGGVDCWMDIQRGIYPKLTPIGDRIKIGEELSVIVYLRDPNNEYDLGVRNCWAYDNEDFDEKGIGKVQLSDASGCSMKKKLFGVWHKTQETGSSGATLLLHNTLRAFKFPDESQVYLKCDIEICRGTCAEAICDDDFNEIPAVDCKINPLHPNCFSTNIVRETTTPLSTDRFTTTKSYGEITTRRFGTRFPFEIVTTTFKPEVDVTTYPTTIFYDRTTTQRTSIRCYPGSKDPRCRQEKNVESTTIRKPVTYPNSFKTSTKKPTFCESYPNSPRCAIYKTTPKPVQTGEDGSNYEIFTLEPPIPSITKVPSGFDCSRNPNDIRCRQLVIPLQCGPGSLYDVRCPNPTPTATPPTYLPPSSTFKSTTSRTIGTTRVYETTERQISTTTPKFFICVPGVNGDCEEKTEQTTTEVDVTTRKTFTQAQFTTKPATGRPICYFGSTNPECKKVTTNILTAKPQQSTTTKIPSSKQPFSTTGRTVPSTRAPNCYPGSLDPRCKSPITTKVYPSVSITTGAPFTTTVQPEESFSTDSAGTTTNIPHTKCYPGSPDPSCHTGSIDCEKYPNDARCNQVIVPLRCGPGFPYDVRCPNPTPTATPPTYLPVSSTSKTTTRIPQKPNCYFGSTNPECNNIITTFRPQQSTTRVPLSTQPSASTPRRLSSTEGPICYPGTLDSRCKFSTTRKTPSFSSSTGVPFTTTFKPEVSISTSATPSTTRIPQTKCYPGSLDPNCFTSTLDCEKNPKDARCNQVIVPLRCGPGFPYDARCKTVTSTKTPPTYLPFSSTTTTEIPIRPQYTTKKTEEPLCRFGSKNPECQKVPTLKPTSERPIPTISRVSTTTSPPICYPGSSDLRCKTSYTTEAVTQHSSTTENVINTTFKPEISIPTVKSSTTAQPRCYPGSPDARCSSKKIDCEKNPKDSRCNQVVPLRCGPGFPYDVRCPNPTPTAAPPTYLPPSTTIKTTTQIPQKPNCYFGSTNPECKNIITTLRPQQSTTRIPSSTRPPITTPKILSSSARGPICYPGSLDSRCKSSTTTTKIIPSISPSTEVPFTTTFKPEVSISTAATPSTTRFPQNKCYPGSLDPSCFTNTLDCEKNPKDARCNQVIVPLRCGPGFPYDVRCPNPTPTANPPTYLPPSTTAKFTTARPSRLQSTTTKVTGKPICYFGSTNPECKKVTTNILTLKPQPSTTEIPSSKQPFSTTDRTYTSTKAPICYPGALDPRCKSSTTTRIIPQFSSSTGIPITSTFKPEISISTAPTETTTSYSQVKCYPGSPDPNCITVSLDCEKNPNDVRCNNVIVTSSVTPPTYFPSSSTIKLTTERPTRVQTTAKATQRPICYFGSTNPECNKVTTNILTLKPQPSTTEIPSSKQPFSTTGRTYTSTKAPICYPGALDPRCKSSTTTKIIPQFSSSTGTPITSTFKPEVSIPSTSTTAPRCYPGSPDPHCASESIDCNRNPNDIRCSRIPLQCGPGFPYDARCKTVTSTKTPPTYSPFSSTTTTTEIPIRPQYTTTKTEEPLCRFGSKNPECQKVPTLKPTSERPIPTISRVSTTTSLPICYPGSSDPRCKTSYTTEAVTHHSSSTENVINTTFKPEISIPTVKSSTTAQPRCYPGSLDARCSTTTVDCEKNPNDIRCSRLVVPLRCGPGFPYDVRCPNPTPTAAPPTYLPPSTTIKTTTRIPQKPNCYFGSTNPECKNIITTLRPHQSTTRIPSSTRPPITTPKILSSSARGPICYPGSLDSRCKSSTTTTQIIPSISPSTEVPFTTTFKPEVSISTAATPSTTRLPQTKCYPGSLDPSCFTNTLDCEKNPKDARCNQVVVPLRCGPGFPYDVRCPNPTPTATPPTYLPPSTTIKTTTRIPQKPNCYFGSTNPECKNIITTLRPQQSTTKISSSTQPSISTPKILSSSTQGPICYPGALDPRCKASTTTTKIIPSSSEHPETTSEKFISSTTTKKVPRVSSPRPFTTRPTSQSTTENVLCYPGSNLPGCKPSLTTPSFCFPGSKDKRCPQLPDTFSTRMPSTYLPPFPDSNANRVKRSTLVENPNHEIIKFSLSFKSFSFSPEE